MKKGVASALAFAGALMIAGVAHACPDGQSDTGWGICLPNVGGSVGDAWEHGKREIPGQAGGPVLEAWINASRNSVTGAQPIPWDIRQALTGYIDEDILNRARYVVGDAGWLNVAHDSMQFGDAAAVTLGDIIVFRGPSEVSDPALWAHELTHVKQYRDWGTRDFAISYVRKSSDVEDPAYQVGNGYWAWRNAQQYSAGSEPGYQSAVVPGTQDGFPPPPPQQGFSTVCWFTNGPRAGTAFNFYWMQPVPVGMMCNDGAFSTGVVVAG